VSNDMQMPDRDQINKARRAAEELFRPKPPADRRAVTVSMDESASAGAAVSVALPAPVALGAPAAPPPLPDIPAPRKPRVIESPAIVPMSNYFTEPASPAPRARVVMNREPSPKKAAVPKRTQQLTTAQYGRIKALARYGMTVTEVAELYGVAPAEIERIVAKG
jgi:hypothetical protein